MTALNTTELYFNNLVEKLNRGQASAFIGAGFSLNAIRKDGLDKKMPDWSALGDIFLERLGLNNENNYNPIELAQQIEVVYGKNYLNNLLKEVLDDDSYQPGNAHSLLIDLPWQDIFTTNYDTLLERAYLNSHSNNKYRVVLNHTDLILSKNFHRIVKLHGSFPSYEPYIISQEDYRTYPKKHGPFVNTVQQSLLENLMVLIGFSGDDPNFNQWIGWIHDNLGLDNSPRIYMVLYKMPSPAVVRMLNSKNIDLIILQDIDLCEGLSYKESIEVFLQKLSDATKKEKTLEDEWHIISIKNEVYSEDELLKVLVQNRESYPGWLFCKHTYLIRINRMLDSIVEWIIESIDKDKNADKIVDVLYEFCWMSNRTGYWGDETLIDAIQSIIEKSDIDEKFEKIIYIELFNLKQCRLWNYDKWEYIHDKIKNKIKAALISEDLELMFKYEEAMQSLYSLEWRELEAKVKALNIVPEKGEWILKKEYLLLMLGKYDECLSLLTQGLEHSRKILLSTSKTEQSAYNRLASIDEALVENYHYLTSIMEGVSQADRNESGYSSIYYDYWNIENTYYADVLEKDYEKQPKQEIKYLFDVGMYQSIHRNNDSENRNKVLKAQSFILFRENTGLPFRNGYYTNYKGLKGCLYLIEDYSFRTSMLYAVISGNSDIFDLVFSKRKLKDYDVDYLNSHCSLCMNALKYCIKRITNYYEPQNSLLLIGTQSLIEIVSRLLSRCSYETFQDAYQLLIECYTLNTIPREFDISILAKRLIEFSSVQQIEENIDNLWNIDILRDRYTIKKAYPDPFELVSHRIGKLDDKSKMSLSSSQREKVINLIKSVNDDEYRFSAIKRILFLRSIYKFDNEIDTNLVTSLNTNCKKGDTSLWELGDFYSVNILEFSQMKNDKTVILDCKSEILNLIEEDSKGKIMRNYIDLLNEIQMYIQKVELSIEEGRELCYSLCKLGKHITNKASYGVVMGHPNEKSNLCDIENLLGYIMLKSGLVNQNESVKDEEISKMQDTMKSWNCPTPLLSWCLSEEDRFSEIILDLQNFDDDYKKSAYFAIKRLLEFNIEVDSKVVDLLINAVITSTHYNITSYIWGIIDLLEYKVLDEEQCDELAQFLSKVEEMTHTSNQDSDSKVWGKLTLRREVMYLARRLYNYYKDIGITIPDEVQEWKVLSTDMNEFAEVRISWEG